MMTIKEMQEDYDWREAFHYADGFTMTDIQDVLGMDPGMNDEEDWIIIGKLKDGRYFKLAAWCDYTGWDCQAGGTCVFASTLDELVRWQMTTKERARLEIPEPK